jgi:hypothetical protein
MYCRFPLGIASALHRLIEPCQEALRAGKREIQTERDWQKQRVFSYPHKHHAPQDPNRCALVWSAPIRAFASARLLFT